MGFFLQRYEKMIEGFAPVIPEGQYLRINTLLGSEESVKARLEERGVTLMKTPLALCYSYEAPFSLSTTTDYLHGRIHLQGLASQAVSYALAPEPEWLVVDMAAAPGSKTTHLSQLMKNKGRIVGLDSSRDRLFALRSNTERLGVYNVVGVRKDARFASDLSLKADAVLLDAPCAGNYCSEESWEEKRTIEGVRENARLQKDLVRSAHHLLKRDGVLVYSTCSLEPEEDEAIVEYALSLGFVLEPIALPDLGQARALTAWDGVSFDSSLKEALRFWPYKTGTEGFFLARLRKRS